MGKWDGYLSKLKKMPKEWLFGDDQGTYFDRVKEQAATIENRKLSELARAYKSKRFEEEQTEEKAKKIRLELRAIEYLMETAFEGEGLKKVDFEEGGSVGFQPEPHTIVVDKEKYRQWCLTQEGLPEQMALVWSKTNSIAKQLLEGGKQPPPGCDIYVRPKFVLRS